MPLVELEQDVYEHLLKNTKVLGETASPILRRLLGLRHPEAAPGNGATAEKPHASAREEALSSFLVQPVYKRMRNVTEQFLSLLGFLFEQNQAEFGKLLRIEGRSRKYFGKSEAEVRQSGHSTHPRQIPGATYWAVTNASNYHKRQILLRALAELGYPERSRREAADSLR